MCCMRSNCSIIQYIICSNKCNTTDNDTNPNGNSNINNHNGISNNDCDDDGNNTNMLTTNHYRPWHFLASFSPNLHAHHDAICHGISVRPVGVSCPAVSPPIFCPEVIFLAGQHVKLKYPWISASTAQQQLNHWRVTKVILTLNPEHSPVPANKRKTNSIPDETRTAGDLCIIPLWK